MTVKAYARRASNQPFTPGSLALTVIGAFFVVSCAAIGVMYWRKRRRAPLPQAIKPDDRSSSAGSEEHQLESIVGNSRNSQQENHRYSVGILSRVSQGPQTRGAFRSPAPNNRHSIGMLSRVSVDPSIASPKPDRSRRQSRTREEKDRAYARMSMGVMSRASMGARSPRPNSSKNFRDSSASAGIMSRMSLAPPSPMLRNPIAGDSPVSRGSAFLEPPPQYS